MFKSMLQYFIEFFFKLFEIFKSVFNKMIKMSSSAR